MCIVVLEMENTSTHSNLMFLVKSNASVYFARFLTRLISSPIFLLVDDVEDIVNTVRICYRAKGQSIKNLVDVFFFLHLHLREMTTAVTYILKKPSSK